MVLGLTEVLVCLFLQTLSGGSIALHILTHLQLQLKGCALICERTHLCMYHFCNEKLLFGDVQGKLLSAFPVHPSSDSGLAYL